MGCKLGIATDNKVAFSSAGMDTWARAYDIWNTQGILNFCDNNNDTLFSKNKSLVF